jgi:nitrate/nitrite-specific signal transduction histidine kinase
VNKNIQKEQYDEPENTFGQRGPRMSRGNKPSSHDLDLNRLAIWALSLLIFIPMLGIIFLFQEQLKENWLPLFFLFLIATLGFYLFMTVIRSVLSILRGLEDVSQGKTDRVEFIQGPTQLREMTEIINSLNKLTQEFQENAAQLEHFIEQFTTLTEMTEITARIPDIRELLSLVLRKAMASTHARKGTVMLLEEEGDRLEIVAAEGWTP